MKAGQPLVQVHNLSHVYGEGCDAITALRGVDLSLQPGEFVAIAGKNGSGKSTLARHFNGLLQPTKGSVVVMGNDTRDRDALPFIRARVAMVFQRPEDQIVATTVSDDVAFGPENLGLSTDEIVGRVDWALELVGATDLRHRSPHLLSVGQQQRVAIAGALAMRPECLVMDEATAMLDPGARRHLLSLIKDLRSSGMCTVLITHRMDEAAQADRLLVMDAGQLVCEGMPSEVLSNAQLTAALGLERPPAAVIASGLATCWEGFSAQAVTVETLMEEVAAWTVRTSAPDETDDPSSSVPGTSLARGSASIVAEDVSYTYLIGTRFAMDALSNVSMEVFPGESVALIGPTGSGKSTLLQILAGLLPPAHGRVTLFGRDLADPDIPRAFVCARVGVMLQRPEEQLFETYVGDDVAFGPRQLGLSHSEVRDRVMWAMELVGLRFSTFKDRFTQSLSGGERRRAALAGVLALRPRILLLDEPTAGLDPRSRQSIIGILRHLRDEGTALVFATHAMEDVIELADRAKILHSGGIVAGDVTSVLLSQSSLLTSYDLAPPETVYIADLLRARGWPVERMTLTAQEIVDTLCDVVA